MMRLKRCGHKRKTNNPKQSILNLDYLAWYVQLGRIKTTAVVKEFERNELIKVIITDLDIHRP